MTDVAADLILACDNIMTMDPRRPRVTAVAVAGGRVSAVGDRRDIPAWRGRRTEVIDLGRATLTPGLVDSHLHPVLGLEMTAGLDLSGCADLASVRAALRDAARASAPGQWIVGWGLDPNSFGEIPVGSGAVEDVLGGRPACLTLFDGHSVLASREALRRAGIDGPRRFGSRSAIVCDEHGHPGYPGYPGQGRPGRPHRPAPDRAYRDAPLGPGAALRRTGRRRLHATHPCHLIHPR